MSTNNSMIINYRQDRDLIVHKILYVIVYKSVDEYDVELKYVIEKTNQILVVGEKYLNYGIIANSADEAYRKFKSKYLVNK